MDIELTAENRDDYLYIVSKGEIRSAEELIKHADLVYGEVVKYNPKKILVYQLDTTFPKNLSSYIGLVNHYIDNFSSSVLAAKVAVVIRAEFSEIGDFWETVCTNRGFLYHAFTDFQTAEKWLLE